MDSRSKSFEDLAVFQRSLELAHHIYLLTRASPFTRDRGFKDQIQRASVSVMCNIAEGFERGSNAEFVQFLYISKASCGEVRAQLRLAHLLGYVQAGKFDEILERCLILSGMLGNMIASLKSSEYRGSKFRYIRPNRAEETKKFTDSVIR